MTIENMQRLVGEIGLVPNPPERLDLRPDEEIRAQLNSYQPVESERNVWAYWGQGFDSMPLWRQRNVINWIRRDGKRWTVRILDVIPGSPNNINQFIDPAYLPKALADGRMKGSHIHQTISDFVRVAALYQYGGVYMDVGIILIRDLDDICWSALEDTSLPYNVAGAMVEKIAFVSFFLAARKQDPFMHRWLQVFVEVWGDRDSSAGTCHHPLLRHLGLVISPAFPPTTNWEELTDYAVVTQSCARVKMNREPGENGFDGPSYFRKHFYILPVVPEVSGTELNASGFMKALMTPCKLPEDATEAEKQDQTRASQLVHEALAGKSMYKFYSGFSHFGVQGLAAKYWDQPENAQKDSEPGSWGEVFRYGTVYYRQTRTTEPLSLPEEGHFTEAGAFDPVVTKA